MKQLRSVLGFAGYYRRFLKNYACIVKHLNDLLIGLPTNPGFGQKKKKSKVPWQLGEPQQAAFDMIKEKLASPPVLAYTDFKRPFIVHTYASTEGLGTVLYQEQDGLEHLIAYASRELRNSEKHYPASKLEFLCLKWAITEKFHNYLYQFQVVTDNNPLTYVLSSTKLDAAGHRWLAALGTYDFKFICRSGKANGDADGLSRRPYENTEIFSDVVKAICQAYTIKRDSCPYAETLEITCAPQLAHVDTQPDIQIQSSELQDVDWVKEQAADVTLNRVIYSLASSVLYRNTVLDGQQTRQLVGYSSPPEQARLHMAPTYLT